MSKLKHIPKETIEEAVKSSKSYAGVLDKLGLAGGGTQHNLKLYIKKLNISTTHFTGMLWNKGIETGPIVPIEDYYSR